MTTLITTLQLYEAAANRTPIYVYYDDIVYGPAVIDELTDFHVKIRGVDDGIDRFVRGECSFYAD